MSEGRTWLVFDSNFLAWRSFHSMPDLNYKDIKTGVLYGFFRDVSNLTDRFDTSHVAFCFDKGQSIRKEVYPKYKAKRHSREMDEEERRKVNELRHQVDRLREEYLPRIGYKNVFAAPGFESDDIMASIVRNKERSDKIIIVTADSDLHQLLTRDDVMVFNPNRNELVTERTFLQKHKIFPPWWWRVKALAGCSTDGVKGIPGVGEKTAVAYLQGTINKKGKPYQRITSEQGERVFKRNKLLVKLPYPGTPNYLLSLDSVDREAWAKVADELGMKSLRDQPPIPSRAVRRRTIWTLDEKPASTKP